MTCPLVPLWVAISSCVATSLLLGCPQVLDDRFQPVGAPDEGLDLIAQGPGGVALDSQADAGVLGSVVTTPPDETTTNTSGVVSSVPANGARGVLPNTALQLTFSAPMNRSSVEAAYVSSDLPAGALSFAWSDGDTVLHILPKAPLRSSEGSDAALVAAVPYTFGIGSGARDATGRALAAKRVSFSVARAITQALGAVQNRDLTGNWRSDGVYGVAECERVDTTVCMGDSISTGQPAYKGFMTFDLGATPTDAIEVSAAQLGWTVAFVNGTPFTSLGTLHIDHVSFAAIGDAAFSVAALPERQTTNTILFKGDTVSYEVLPAVQADWAARHYVQFRLAFDTATDGDGALDLLGCDWSTVKLSLTYWLP